MGAVSYYFKHTSSISDSLHVSLKDDTDMQRKMKSLYCSANKLRIAFDQCIIACKTTLFRAYCMTMYAREIWC